MIRLSKPSIGVEELRAVADSLATGFLVQGSTVKAFEQALAERIGVAHAIAVSSGTAALGAALEALALPPGSSVATTTYSWPATANVIVRAGLEPHFVDIEDRTYNLDVGLLERELRAGLGIAAVLVVHAFGNMADMARLAALSHEFGFAVIEDAACALGASLGKRQAGAWGVLGCFSFHPRKSITTGEGGLVTTADGALARRLRMIRNHGIDPDSDTVDFAMAGANLRLTEFQAALGLGQLARFDTLIARRRALALRYDEVLGPHGLTTPRSLVGAEHAFQTYVVLIPSARAPDRDALLARIRSNGVEVTIGTHHVPLTRYFRERYGFARGRFPVTDDIAGRAISLPLHDELDDASHSEVCRVLIEALRAV
jgi:perosamine synthetase